MIRPEMAQKFIDQITEYTDYNINIMDETGVIIASRDPKRVGTYHEAADRIIRGSEEIVTVDDEKLFPGVLPGTLPSWSTAEKRASWASPVPLPIYGRSP